MPILPSTLLSQPTGDATDASLVREFLRTRSGTVFQELMRRHGPLVWSVGRRMNLTVADAEDVFQATFLVLFEQARRWQQSGSLAAWLHGIAWRIGTRLQRSAVRERQRQHAVAKAEGYDQRDDGWLTLLDAELARLPAQYREPMVLCYLEGQSQREAAHTLGWPLGTVAGRLARAKALLQKRLVRQGIAPAVIATPMIESVSAGLPPGLEAQTWQSVVQGGVPHLQLLIQGVTVMSMSKKLALVAMVVMVLGMGGWGLGRKIAQDTVPPSGQKEPPADQQPSIPSRLLATEKHILESLIAEQERVYTFRYSAYKAGKENVTELLRSLEQWMESRLDQAKGASDAVIAILTDCVNKATSIEHIAYAKLQAGSATQLEHSTTRAARLAIELKLFRSKPPAMPETGKAKPHSK